MKCKNIFYDWLIVSEFCIISTFLKIIKNATCKSFWHDGKIRLFSSTPMKNNMDKLPLAKIIT